MCIVGDAQSKTEEIQLSKKEIIRTLTGAEYSKYLRLLEAN